MVVKSTEVKAVQLTAMATVDGAMLEVRHTVENPTAAELLLVNRIHRWTDEGHVILDERFYTVVEGDHLQLTVAYLPVPDHVDVESPDMPMVTRVLPGGRFEGIFRATLPLEPYYPYPGVVTWADPPRTYGTVSVAVGWIPAAAAPVSAQDDGSGGQALFVDHKVAAREQQLAQAPLSISIPTVVKASRSTP